jgi:DNA-binding response OmpR family regulator
MFTVSAEALVLVAARQPIVRRLVSVALKPAGFSVVECDAPIPTAEILADVLPDVIVIETDGASTGTFRAIHSLAARRRVPVLLMSPEATPMRAADSLDAGADDYIARPFDPAELAARIRSLVRRQGDRLHAGRRLVGGAVVDISRREVTVDGRPVNLNRHEWRLLAMLLANEGRIMLREELLTAGFGEESRDDAGQLRVTIGRLRRKLGIPAWDEGPIRTIHGIGYAFDPAGRMPRTWSGRRRPRDGAADGADGSEAMDDAMDGTRGTAPADGRPDPRRARDAEREREVAAIS